MKILYCIPRTVNSGGMERIVSLKANWLAQHNNNVILVTTDQKKESEDFFKLDESIKRYDLELFYNQDSKGNIFFNFLKRRRKLKKHKKFLEKIINTEQPDIVISTFGREEKFLYKIKSPCKKVVEIHFCKNRRNLFQVNFIKKLYYKYVTVLDNFLVKKYDKFICLTNEDKKYWKKVKNITVIPNFINKENNDISKLDKKNIIAVGRLEYQKGYDRMIKAWEIVNTKHPDWKLNIYGDGPLKSQLSNLICEKKLEGKVILNEPKKNIYDEFLNHSALILTSHFEGLPLVLIEAMSYGLPIISFDCQCGPKDIIEQGKNGYLVENGNIELFAQAIIKIIEDKKLRNEIGQNGYQKSVIYNQDEIMKEWMKMFKQLI